MYPKGCHLRNLIVYGINSIEIHIPFVVDRPVGLNRSSLLSRFNTRSVTMWIPVTEENESGSYDGAKLQLEAAVYCTKEEFAEQLRLGQTEELQQGMIATVFVIENFLRAADRERARLQRLAERLHQQDKHQIVQLPPDRSDSYRFN